MTGPAGCLLIVTNYGDRLNFGLAAERARAFGHKVSMVIVDDDVALPDLPQSRGVAGTLFVHKIAGAMAEKGANLEPVTRAAERIINATRSIGMSLDTCTVPGSPKETADPAGKGRTRPWHPRRSRRRADRVPAQNRRSAVTEKLAATMPTAPHVALINNLGGASVLEMSILATELVKSHIGSRIDLIVGPAAMMTSLACTGFRSR